MKNKIRLIKSVFATGKAGRKNLLLTIVALALVLVTMAVATFSWIETTSSVQVYIEEPGQIDTHTYSIANIGTTTDAGKEINLTDYFRESGNVHLSPALSADGENFYFRKISTGSSTPYRKGTINDKNVNYISFSFKINAVDSDTEFYFDSVPTIKIGDDTITDNSVRIAISSDSSTAVYSNKAAGETISINGTNHTATVLPFKDYADETAISSLFRVTKETTQTITITLWLNDTADADYTGKTVTVENFKLITSAQKTTQIKFVDKTTAFNGLKSGSTTEENNGYGWISNDDAQMWVAYGDTAAKMTKTTDDDGFTVWTFNAKSIGSADDVAFYRCSSVITENPQENFWNMWLTTWSEAVKADSDTYTAYSSSAVDTSTGYNVGYGVWDSVVEYTLDSEDTSVLPLPATGQTYNATHVTMNVGEISCDMNYYDGLWRGFVPVSGSTPTVTFTFTNGSTNYTVAPATSTGHNYTITSATTGYWGTPATIKTDFVTGSSDTAGTVSVSGGKSGATTVKVTKGTSVTLTATAKDGYAFDGWYEKSDGSGTKLTSATVTANADKTYYAKFVKKYTITVDYVTGCSTMGTVSVSGSSSVAVAEGTQVTLTASAKTGYKFDGWYENADGSGTKLTSATVTVSVNKTYYAKFMQETYTITVSYVTGCSGMGTVSVSGSSSVTVTSGTQVTLAASANSGYEFEGWYDNVNGTGTKLSSSTITVGQSKTYYAKFKSQARRIYFTNNKGWTTVNCYVWNSSGDNGDWPGKSMTYLTKNGYGEEIYYVDLPTSSNFTNIIFNNESEQTVDITLSDSVNQYYLIDKNSDGKYTVGTATYTE